MKFVLDYTVSMRWLMRDGSAGDQQLADRVLANLVKNEAWVPSLWWTDMTSVISKAEKNNLISQSESTQFLRLLEPLPISERLIPGSQLLQNTLELSRRYGLNANRAAYIVLAMTESLPLATVDETLRKAALRSGVLTYPS
jgi:predicted nucleic acid-binding protein